MDARAAACHLAETNVEEGVAVRGGTAGSHDTPRRVEMLVGNGIDDIRWHRAGVQHAKHAIVCDDGSQHRVAKHQSVYGSTKHACLAALRQLVFGVDVRVKPAHARERIANALAHPVSSLDSEQRERLTATVRPRLDLKEHVPNWRVECGHRCKSSGGCREAP